MITPHKAKYIDFPSLAILAMNCWLSHCFSLEYIVRVRKVEKVSIQCFHRGMKEESGNNAN